MNVLFVSQCNKRALVETRRILDQFAERRGERTWHTPVTQAGLDTIRQALRRTARKNTAVACHWIHHHGRTELVWIVGDARRFNASGAVPTNTTKRNVLRRRDEDDWSSSADMSLITAVAALFHDFGKASRAFQRKLEKGEPVADAYRHEWVSLRLFEAFVDGDDNEAWLARLSACDFETTRKTLERLTPDPSEETAPFSSGRMTPLAQAIGWLILTHHRLPRNPGTVNGKTLEFAFNHIAADWAYPNVKATEQARADCWRLEQLPFSSRSWSRRARLCATTILSRPGFLERSKSFLDDPFLMHLSRLTLMLADHHYSSLPSNDRFGDVPFPLYANTDRATGAPKQRLDEHLVGVASHSKKIFRALPRLEHELPRIARHKGFRRRADNERFRWQDKAHDLAASVRESAREHGFFGVNMASTGCGKTLANGKILYALADPHRGARFTIALGLRTLTLQTGEAYRSRLQLGEDDLAILVGGGGAIRELAERSGENGAELLAPSTSGSESAAPLLPDEFHVHFEGDVSAGPLKEWLDSTPAAQKLVQAPILTCTIDHLMPATESLRGGHQIAPMLRLLTADLVLDEPDDLDIDDLHALSRLVHFAGMLGSRILLSSATLPPSLVSGLFAAYRAGRESFERNRGTRVRTPTPHCAWFDEFGCDSAVLETRRDFQEKHERFVDKRLAKLRKAEPRRRAAIVAVPPPNTGKKGVVDSITQCLHTRMQALHEQNNTLDPRTKKRVSFGLVRMANIAPLIEVARGLYRTAPPPNTRLHLCVYHSRHPLLMRSAIENVLDRMLSRHEPLRLFDLPMIRSALDHSEESEHLFVVLASPVAEVGRDHDYDWGIIEPSSARSIIQLAGRIRRHRTVPHGALNVSILNRNVKALRGDHLAFSRPGFETARFALGSHHLDAILLREQYEPLDAGPRIRPRFPLHAQENLVDLEHARLESLMSDDVSLDNTVPRWWTTRAYLLSDLQRSEPFRRTTPDQIEDDYALIPGVDGPLDDDFSPTSEEEEGESSRLSQRMTEPPYQWVERQTLKHPPLEIATRVEPWGHRSYLAPLADLARRHGMPLLAAARRYGHVQLRRNVHEWLYHPLLGFEEFK